MEEIQITIRNLINSLKGKPHYAIAFYIIIHTYFC